MSPMLVTYIGLVVAVIILLWGVFEIVRRQYERKKIDSRMMNTWVSLKPTSLDMQDEPFASADRDDQHDLRSKAQQNGHYSESKRKL